MLTLSIRFVYLSVPSTGSVCYYGDYVLLRRHRSLSSTAQQRNSICKARGLTLSSTRPFCDRSSSPYTSRGSCNRGCRQPWGPARTCSRDPSNGFTHEAGPGHVTLDSKCGREWQGNHIPAHGQGRGTGIFSRSTKYNPATRAAVKAPPLLQDRK